VLAARDEAMTSAFCLATDATGVSIQPTRLNDENGGRKLQACRKGHFFVTLADHDHVFFSFEPKHTSEAVCKLFAGREALLKYILWPAVAQERIMPARTVWYASR
jgi:transposase